MTIVGMTVRILDYAVQYNCVDFQLGSTAPLNIIQRSSRDPSIGQKALICAFM